MEEALKFVFCAVGILVGLCLLVLVAAVFTGIMQELIKDIRNGGRSDDEY